MRPRLTIDFVAGAAFAALLALSGVAAKAQMSPPVNVNMPGCVAGSSIVVASPNGFTCKMTQFVRGTTDSTGLLVWTFGTAFGAGVVPVCIGQADGPDPQNAVIVNVQNEGTPTNTQAKFRVTKSTATSVALLGLTIGVVSPSSGATTLNAVCREP